MEKWIFFRFCHVFRNARWDCAFGLANVNFLTNLEIKGIYFEGSEDAGGPYREAIHVLCEEYQSDVWKMLIKTQ